MATGTATPPAPREDRTIILAINQEEYEHIILDPTKFRAWIDENYRLNPEIFPETFGKGYKLHGKSTSDKIGILKRRIKLRNGQPWTIHPSFVMPRMTGMTEEIAKALYLRKYGVPYEALAYVFGRDENYWYRIETQFGEKSIVATTVKVVEVPEDLLADEHHTWINGEKVYIATTVTHGVVLGAEVSPGSSKDELQQAYGVFKEEAFEVEPEYAPKTVNTDGWGGTQGAWAALFSAITIIRCFLHSWLRIRERGKKLENFFELGKKVWEVFLLSPIEIFGMRVRITLPGVFQRLRFIIPKRNGSWGNGFVVCVNGR